jgi:hypothetical protein
MTGKGTITIYHWFNKARNSVMVRNNIFQGRTKDLHPWVNRHERIIGKGDWSDIADEESRTGELWGVSCSLKPVWAS